MNKKIMTKWVKALRSGKYRKTREVLCKVAENGNKSWCCLGVLTDLYNKEHKQDPIEIDACDTDLPYAVKEWSNMGSYQGSLPCGYGNLPVTSLAELNDCKNSKRSFKRMADIIEKNWEQL
jgi:hypothetical protein